MAGNKEATTQEHTGEVSPEIARILSAARKAARTGSSKALARSYYAILGQELPSAPLQQSELRRSYRKVAIKVHPDKAPAHCCEQATEAFKALSEAYGNLESIELQEQVLRAAAAGCGGGGGRAAGWSGGGARRKHRRKGAAPGATGASSAAGGASGGARSGARRERWWENKSWAELEAEMQKQEEEFMEEMRREGAKAAARQGRRELRQEGQRRDERRRLAAGLAGLAAKYGLRLNAESGGVRSDASVAGSGAEGTTHAMIGGKYVGGLPPSPLPSTTSPVPSPAPARVPSSSISAGAARQSLPFWFPKGGGRGNKRKPPLQPPKRSRQAAVGGAAAPAGGPARPVRPYTAIPSTCSVLGGGEGEGGGSKGGRSVEETDAAETQRLLAEERRRRMTWLEADNEQGISSETFLLEPVPHNKATDRGGAWWLEGRQAMGLGGQEAGRCAKRRRFSEAPTPQPSAPPLPPSPSSSPSSTSSSSSSTSSSKLRRMEGAGRGLAAALRGLGRQRAGLGRGLEVRGSKAVVGKGVGTEKGGGGPSTSSGAYDPFLVEESESGSEGQLEEAGEGAGMTPQRLLDEERYAQEQVREREAAERRRLQEEDREKQRLANRELARRWDEGGHSAYAWGD